MICVTGSLGGSGLRKHLEFEPRVDEALEIARIADLHAMMDLSDGLSTDLNRICHQSGVGAMVEASALPISEDAKAQADPLSAALNEGEDFELLFTLSPDQWEQVACGLARSGADHRGRHASRIPDGWRSGCRMDRSSIWNPGDTST